MKKFIIIGFVAIFISSINAQKLQLTEAATQYKNNLSPMWMMQPDQLQQNKAVLVKAKKAIDESYAKQMSSPILKEKDLTKMYYYRGMIYLDYAMMAAMDEELKANVESIPEEQLENASFGSLKKCMELDTKKQWNNYINNKVQKLRVPSFNSGLESLIFQF